MKHRKYSLCLFIGAALLAGCATGPGSNPQDPLEPLNRGVSQFNESVDQAVLKPVATVYQNVVPDPVQLGVNNFFDNLTDLWSFVNNVLQLKGEAAADSFMRFSLNTVWGLGGVLDIAGEAGIPQHKKDFGHTLGYWGVGPGPYIVLPLLGPSTLRDSVAFFTADARGDLVLDIDHVPTRNQAYVLRVVDTRASLLGSGTLLEEAALDKYSFSREAYLQYRRNQIYDGNPPEDHEEAAVPPVKEQEK